MSTKVQTDLHKFFKVKKNYSNDLAKSKLKQSEVSESNETKRKQLNVFQNDICENVKSENEADSFNTVISKKNLQNGLTAPENSPASSVASTPHQTPKRKDDDEQITQRKRKRVQMEEGVLDISVTPPIDRKLEPSLTNGEVHLEHTSTVRKKLLMEDEGKKTRSLKKLNPQDIKKQLGRNSNLDELRSKLLKLNECEAKLRKFRGTKIAKAETSSDRALLFKSPKKLLLSPRKHLESPRKCVPPSPRKLQAVHPQLEHFKSLEVDVVSPVKSPVKVVTPAKTPCYEKFEHLVATPSKATSSSAELAIPHRYRLLKEVFRAVDTVVSLLHNRHEITTYTKLKPAVQEMIRRAFDQNHLGQLKTVFPLAYIFKQEKLRNKKSENPNGEHYQLTVTPSMNYKSPVATNLMSKFDSPSFKKPEGFRKMDSVVMVERRQIFHESLLKLLHIHHNEYLKTLDPPVEVNGPILRWHPLFPIEDISTPDPSDLPQPPDQDKMDNAKDVLDRARNIFSVNDRMKIALENAVKSNPIIKIETPTQETQTTEIVTALKGVSLSLLEKIRAREAKKAAEVMTRPVCENKSIQMLSRLPEMVRIVRNLFVTEKKAALPVEFIDAKVSQSHSAMLGASEVNSHLVILMKEIPGWCSVHKVRSGMFYKINKAWEINDVSAKLEKLLNDKK